MANIEPVQTKNVKLEPVHKVANKVTTKIQETKDFLKKQNINIETLDFSNKNTKNQIKGAYNEYLKEKQEQQNEAQRLQAAKLKYDEYKELIKSGKYDEKTLALKYGDVMSKYANYNWENLYNILLNSPLALNIPTIDLSNTEYQNVSNFNKHIKDNVNEAGYGTRNAVLAAAKSLICDYTLATGNRLRYSQPLRQITYDENLRINLLDEGIVNEDFYLDCSSFVAWAIYNAGFEVPNAVPDKGFTYTENQKNWALDNKYNVNPANGTSKGGDLLVCHSDKGEHVALIVDNDGENYYTAEFTGDDTGGEIKKYTYDEAASQYDIAVDMTDYYTNSKNIRNK